jgi:ribose transport system substrate-binding protein
VQEICGKLPSSQINREIMDAGTTDQAITKTTDWLTAHPQAKHILSTTIDDERATGIAKAFVASHRDGYAVGPGCDTVGIAAVKEAPAATNRYLGCVAFFPEKYPNYVMSIALDVLQGKPVPQEVHIAHKFLDHNTIGAYYH